MRNSTSDNDII